MACHLGDPEFPSPTLTRFELMSAFVDNLTPSEIQTLAA